ncbi:hypothetical protein QVD17_03884 [Tagetes erecta]|uniref:Uncharacterized protein n=1 Tax=Tagetes erecta TaxID=13708 RepID=A0AAD8LF78_TARER|nr:hypothetical protein QVD17_03884 [Tagetes erecta]
MFTKCRLYVVTLLWYLVKTINIDQQPNSSLKSQNLLHNVVKNVDRSMLMDDILVLVQTGGYETSAESVACYTQKLKLETEQRTSLVSVPQRPIHHRHRISDLALPTHRRLSPCLMLVI